MSFLRAITRPITGAFNTYYHSDNTAYTILNEVKTLKSCALGNDQRVMEFPNEKFGDRFNSAPIKDQTDMVGILSQAITQTLNYSDLEKDKKSEAQVITLIAKKLYEESENHETVYQSGLEYEKSSSDKKNGLQASIIVANLDDIYHRHKYDFTYNPTEINFPKSLFKNTDQLKKQIEAALTSTKYAYLLKVKPAAEQATTTAAQEAPLKFVQPQIVVKPSAPDLEKDTNQSGIPKQYATDQKAPLKPTQPQLVLKPSAPDVEEDPDQPGMPKQHTAAHVATDEGQSHHVDFPNSTAVIAIQAGIGVTAAVAATPVAGTAASTAKKVALPLPTQEGEPDDAMTLSPSAPALTKKTHS